MNLQIEKNSDYNDSCVVEAVAILEIVPFLIFRLKSVSEETLSHIVLSN